MEIGVVSIAIGLLAIILLFLMPYIRRKRCSVEVYATIEKVIRGNVTVNGEKMYSSICSYYYNGRTYKNTIQNNVHKYELQEGNKYTININPNNPNEVCLKNKELSLAGILAIFFGIVFILLGLYVVAAEINIGGINDSSDAIKVEESTLIDMRNNKDNSIQTNNKDNMSILCLKDDKEIIQMREHIKNTSNYIEMYSKDYDTKLDDKLGSDMSNIKGMASKSYTDNCNLIEDIDNVIFYLPREFNFVKQEGITYYYEHIEKKSLLNIYIMKTYSIADSREELNIRANYNWILNDVNHRVNYNNNLYEICKGRNMDGDYIDIACSVNKNYTVYIEYNHILGTENIFEEFLKSFKY